MSSLTLTLSSIPPCTLPRTAVPHVTSKCDVTFCDVTISGDVTLLRGRRQRHNGNTVARTADAVALRPPINHGVVWYSCATCTNVWRQIYTVCKASVHHNSPMSRDVESKSSSKAKTAPRIVYYAAQSGLAVVRYAITVFPWSARNLLWETPSLARTDHSACMIIWKFLQQRYHESVILNAECTKRTFCRRVPAGLVGVGAHSAPQTP